MTLNVSVNILNLFLVSLLIVLSAGFSETEQKNISTLLRVEFFLFSWILQLPAKAAFSENYRNSFPSKTLSKHSVFCSDSKYYQTKLINISFHFRSLYL